MRDREQQTMELKKFMFVYTNVVSSDLWVIYVLYCPKI